MAGNVALEVDRVEVRYGRQAVLKGLSLGVAPGEFIALLGASGCGKTTLLRAISGFVPVDAGAIRIDGRDITQAPPDKREMAMVFQSYALWPHMTAAQNIGYGLKLRRWARTEIDRRVDEMLAMLKLDGLGTRLVTQLSGGQRQRVALGRALAVNPRILLLDEPLSNLDARIREEVRHEIKALQQSLGITTIHVTHDREEAMVMADRIVILDRGEIAQQGAPEAVYNHPVSPFVAAFMGAGNIVSLTARKAAGGVIIAAGAHNAEALLPGAGPVVEGKVAAHFRSEAANLVAGDAPEPAGHLVLRGTVVQCTFPGGVFRYGVTVGADKFLVDDVARWPVGAAVGIVLPADAVHLYAAQ